MSIRPLCLGASIAFLTFAAPCGAVITISGNNNGGAGLVLADANGNALPTGSAIRVGYFNDPVTNAAILAGNSFAAINSLFTPLGEGAANGGNVTTGALAVGATSGKFTVAVSNITQTYLPVSTPIYFWVFNNTTPAAAQQWAIFTNNDANSGGSPWVAPFDDPNLGGSATFAVRNDRVDDVDDVVRGAVAAGQLRLSAVPEPGMIALCLAAIPLFGRRRRS